MKNRTPRDTILRLVFRWNLRSNRAASHYSFGLPIAKGLISPGATPYLISTESYERVELEDIRFLSYWEDGSIRWLLVNIVLNPSVKTESEYVLMAGDASFYDPTASTFSREKKVETSPNDLSCLRPKQSFNGMHPFKMYVTDTENCQIEVKFDDEEDIDSNAWFVSRKQYNSTTVLPSGSKLQVAAILTSYQQPLVNEVEIKLHNPSSAVHENGLWDLGDPATLEFKSIHIEYEVAVDEKCSILLESDDPNCTIQLEMSSKTVLRQYSSGGINDHNCVHVNKHGQVPIIKSGFELHSDEKLIENGSRATPTVLLSNDNGVSCITPQNFWQTFPSAIEIFDNTLSLVLYANHEVGHHELQPGERTSKHIIVERVPLNGLPSNPHKLELVDIDFLESQSGLNVLECLLYPGTTLGEKLIEFLLEPEDFIDKREAIDEYGWRNFGDVHADHESLYVRSGESQFVSHYNNQYDLVLGFGLQYLRTSDTSWLRLMNDLVSHVVDIDIYKTCEDRPEYNNGLFWHTNHYERAETASHRTYSIKNYDSNKPWGSSGGPGAEHCYTTGLALHYFLTGEKTSADEVVALTFWIDSHLNGCSCFLASLFSIAKNEIPKLCKLISGHKLPVSRYPMTRGTGNYLRACLDSFAVSGDRKWILKADYIVLHTFHSGDDIDIRNLEDIEGTWFYTIFLQEVCRYLICKDDIESHDAYYVHAQMALVHYLRWMLVNEEPYLDRPELLEFVNDTWAAQDVRRYMLLVSAATLDVDYAAEYIVKSETFARHIEEKILTSETSHFTRIQAILLQNIYRETTLKPMLYPLIKAGMPRNATCLVELKSCVRKIWVGLCRFNIRSELHWIRTRA